jgi:RAD3-like DEAD/DEAH box helicase
VVSELTATLSDRFSSIYRDLVSFDLQRELFNRDSEKLALKDLAYLISVASRLSLNAAVDSEIAGSQCQLAYDVAVRSLKFANGTQATVAPMCECILARIGNFPARNLLRQTTSSLNRVVDPFLELEVAVREEENKSQDVPDGVILTDFQVRLLTALREAASVSVSAPTSAGKSFTLELELLNRLAKSGPYTAIYLVPTRALIRQVSIDLSELMSENGVQCSVLSSLSVPQDNAPDDPKRFIFVLTQERFATFLSMVPAELNLDVIVVDEAQEIGKDRRGITLERVIRLATRKYPKAQLFFSSPLRSNPGYLLSVFDRPASGSAHFVEYQRPVTQNIILVKKVSGRGATSAADFEVLTDVGVVQLGRVELPFKFRNRYVVNFAKYFTAADDVSIIYCNRPSVADKAAMELSDLCEELHDDELEDFGEFLRQEVHRFYRLGSMVRKGIGFHYANIPQIVRSRIEELAKRRKLRFICCTSTLLQGVNLPAKNIFLENPKTGQGESGKIQPGDFWNLIGRAGRLNHEFSGNVFCIYGKPWETDPFVGDRTMPIESAFQVALTKRAGELAFWASKPPESADGSEAWAEQSFANIYADYISTKSRLSDSAKDDSTKVHLASVDSTCETAYAERTLPDDVYTNNMYMHPRRLEELAKLFRNVPSLVSVCPASPNSTDSYQNLLGIFKIIEEIFIRSHTERYRYFAFLAIGWMGGKPIRDLLNERLEYKNIPSDENLVNDEIRDLFKEIEEDLRYRYVKYTSIYLQVLAVVLREKGESERADNLLPLHMFLEFGASNRVLINLMCLGLSRTSAILLARTVSLAPDTTLEECRKYLATINLERISIPRICKAEIARMRGKSA